MKKVLLLVDQKARDLASVFLVGEYLRDFGIHVSYCNKGNMLAAFERVQPNVLVLSCSEGQYKELACYAAPTCKIVLMTQEGACATKESTILRHTMAGMGVDTYIRGLSRVYLWSELSKQWLLEEAVYPEHVIRVFSTSRVDAYRQADVRAPDPTGSIRVGFANRGASINPAIKSNPIQELDQYRALDGSHRAYMDENREWEDWIWHCMASVRTTLDLIETLAATGRYEIVFRPDPYEDYTSYDFLKEKYPNFRVNVDPILANFIEDIDVLVTEFSTTGIDALLLRKPVISTQKLIGPRLVDHNSRPNHLNPSQMRLYWQPADKAEFLQMINDAVSGTIPYSPARDEAEAYLREFYSWPSDGPSAAYLIAKDIEMLCHSDASAEQAELHRSEYREHPFVNRLASRTGLPVSITRKLFLQPFLFDIKHLFKAYRRGDFHTHVRMEYYWWQRKDTDRVRTIFQRLKRKDQAVRGTVEGSDGRSRHRDHAQSNQSTSHT